MKNRSIYIIILYSVLFISSILLIIFSNQLYKDNKEMIIKFKEKEVYDRKGIINITKLNNEIDNSLGRIKELLNKDVDNNDDLKVLIKDFRKENIKYSNEIDELNKQVGELEEKNDSLKKNMMY
jgi:predicted  nucleic acid-binding Zn-ribbon protein